jgi:hypothetical protein
VQAGLDLIHRIDRGRFLGAVAGRELEACPKGKSGDHHDERESRQHEDKAPLPDAAPCLTRIDRL